jgi:sialic acid synthase SpsE
MSVSNGSAPGNNPGRRRVIVVAELGTGHGGHRDRARRLIAAAASAGADRAKFQHFYADEIIHPATGSVNLPGGPVRLYDRFRELETGPDFLSFLKTACREEGVEFFCAPFGIQSARELLDLGETRFKIASPELNHQPLLRFLRDAPGLRELVLSTGVSRLGDIEESLSLLAEPRNETAGGHRIGGDVSPEIHLLHCITAYPSPEEEYNLELIPNLARIFGKPAGISDHSLDPVLVPVLAVLRGAVMVEKHFTLSREDGGLDDPIALPPDDFAAMSRAIREAEALAAEGVGPRDYRLHSSLAKVSPERIAAILGTGIKKLAESESANYGRSNRSIHVLADLPAGHRIVAGDLAILRTEKELRPGLHPRHLEEITGKTLFRDITAGQGLVWEDLLPGDSAARL